MASSPVVSQYRPVHTLISATRLPQTLSPADCSCRPHSTVSRQLVPAHSDRDEGQHYTHSNDSEPFSVPACNEGNPVDSRPALHSGQTDDNLNAIIQGWIDTPLNAEGERQARETGDFLKDHQFDFCFSSDLQRCVRTTELILSRNARPPPIVQDSRVRERFLGALQGKKYYSKYDPHGREEDSKEHIDKFQGRLLDFWDDLFPQNSDRSSLLTQQTSSNGGGAASAEDGWKDSEEPIRILVVSHGGPIKILLPSLISARGYAGHVNPQGLKIGNCSISTVQVTGDAGQWQGQVTGLATVAHLLPQDVTVKGDADV